MEVNSVLKKHANSEFMWKRWRFVETQEAFCDLEMQRKGDGRIISKWLGHID